MYLSLPATPRTHMLSLTVCPEPGCVAPAEIVDRFVQGSTDGPIEHVRIRCVRRHWFLLPVAMLADAAGRSRTPARDPRSASRARRGSP
jgi:hypothetical protein